MAYTVAQLARLDPRTISSTSSGDRQARCVDCACELRENVTGYRVGTGGARCSDCYFNDLSEILEQHPVGLPRMRR